MTRFRLIAAGAAVAAATAVPLAAPAFPQTAPSGKQANVLPGTANLTAPAASNSPSAGGAAPGAAKSAFELPPCAANPDLLGLSRIVEINTETGPRFGDQYRSRHEVTFLEDHEVIITFDDGPLRRYTEPILKALDAQCTRATFFSVGRMAIADPEMLKEVIQRGHTVGVHTWSHKNLGKLEAKDIRYEFELGLSAVAKAAGSPIAPFFRFPYLSDNRTALEYVAKRGMGIYGIHVDSQDFRTRNPGTVLKNVMAQLEHVKKGIILFHDIQPATASALTSLLQELKAKGYKVVHMIPRDAPKTLPEFDAIAERALAAKAKTAAQDPMATRAVTWPVSTTPPPGKPEAAGEEVLPWLAKPSLGETAGSGPSSEAKARKTTRPKSTITDQKHSGDIKPLGN